MSNKNFFVLTVILFSLFFLCLALWGNRSIKNTKAIIEENNKVSNQVEMLKLNNYIVNENTEKFEKNDINTDKKNIEKTEGFQILRGLDSISKIIISSAISLLFSILIMLLLFIKNRTSSINVHNTEKFDFLEDEENVLLFYQKKIVDINTNSGVNKIINSLNDGNVVIIPCDTIYGLCGVVSDKMKQSLIDIKNRPDEKNNFIILATLSQAHKLFGRNLNRKLYALWPGPISFIAFKKHENYTVCVRVPDDEKLQKILSKTGPIYSTSVNMSGEPSINNVYEMCIKFGEKVDLVAKDDNREFTLSSTIIKATSKTLIVVREGSYPIENLEKIAEVKRKENKKD